MDWEGVIFGGVAIVWGVILLFMRPEILQLSREGGKGLRNREVINVLVILAVIITIVGGTAVILLQAL
jgi:hypothetical protein